MRFDIANWKDLRQAVQQMDKTGEPKVLVFVTPGGIFHRFVINDHGVEKQDCDKTGRTVD
jgi:hypothetical protein